ncbi:MAG: mycobacterial-type methylenetetrahydrofolate reductase [Opitutales bacterium]
MKTIALEFVPPNQEDGPEKAAEEARKVRELSKAVGIDGRIKHLMIPGMIEEDPDRPVTMKPKMDPLDVWTTARNEVPDMQGLCTQVTPFLKQPELTERLKSLREAGMDGIIFVGVPRTMADGEGDGMPPTDALHTFTELVPNRGVILIPTRDSEFGRFNFKCEQGATFAMTQLLYSDAIVSFLKDFAARTEHRPEIMLSFGFVPKAENNVKLIDWLIQDAGNPAVEAEQKFVARLAETPLQEKKAELLDLYKRVIDGVQGLGFPLSIHLEAPYGFTKPAFETFAEMLEYWAPDQS